MKHFQTFGFYWELLCCEDFAESENVKFLTLDTSSINVADDTEMMIWKQMQNVDRHLYSYPFFPPYVDNEIISKLLSALFEIYRHHNTDTTTSTVFHGSIRASGWWMKCVLDVTSQSPVYSVDSSVLQRAASLLNPESCSDSDSAPSGWRILIWELWAELNILSLSDYTHGVWKHNKSVNCGFFFSSSVCRRGSFLLKLLITTEKDMKTRWMIDNLKTNCSALTSLTEVYRLIYNSVPYWSFSALQCGSFSKAESCSAPESPAIFPLRFRSVCRIGFIPRTLVTWS